MDIECHLDEVVEFNGAGEGYMRILGPKWRTVVYRGGKIKVDVLKLWSVSSRAQRK